MMFVSGKADTVAGCGSEAAAAPASVTAAVAARAATSTACHKLFRCMLLRSVDLSRPQREANRLDISVNAGVRFSRLRGHRTRSAMLAEFAVRGRIQTCRAGR